MRRWSPLAWMSRYLDARVARLEAELEAKDVRIKRLRAQLDEQGAWVRLEHRRRTDVEQRLEVVTQAALAHANQLARLREVAGDRLRDHAQVGAEIRALLREGSQ